MLTENLFHGVRNSYALYINFYGIVLTLHKTILDFFHDNVIAVLLRGHKLCWSKTVKYLTSRSVYSNIVDPSLISWTNVWDLFIE